MKLTVTLRFTLARLVTGIRQLQHGRALTFDEIGYQYNLPIREFQRVVMRGRTTEIDLPESRNLVL